MYWHLLGEKIDVEHDHITIDPVHRVLKPHRTGSRIERRSLYITREFLRCQSRSFKLSSTNYSFYERKQFTTYGILVFQKEVTLFTVTVLT